MARVKIWFQHNVSEATVAYFQNNEKIWISCVDKAGIYDGRNIVLAK